MTQVAKFKDNAGLNTGSYSKYYQQIATLGHHVDILSIPITFTGFFIFTLLPHRVLSVSTGSIKVIAPYGDNT